MSEKISEEIIKYASKLKEEYKTLEECQKAIEEKYGKHVSINTLSRRIRRVGEVKQHVLLTPQEQKILEERFGSVGRGVRQAVKDALFRYKLPDDPIVSRALLDLKLRFGTDTPVSWAEIHKALKENLGLDDMVATKVLQELCRDGYLWRGRDGNFTISEQRRNWVSDVLGMVYQPKK